MRQVLYISVYTCILICNRKGIYQ